MSSEAVSPGSPPLVQIGEDMLEPLALVCTITHPSLNPTARISLSSTAWHSMTNGMYEVFTLMEFCPGLRERLSEAEILQIFVDVCEGVAYMHHSPPPLLHRDLKLCDFGSYNSRDAPASHDTGDARSRALQMVDLYLRHPVERRVTFGRSGTRPARHPVPHSAISGVFGLDELIPMLREHAAEGPSVFELLALVHRIYVFYFAFAV
ncbi:hypothetical protein FB45DRAFT_859238 [Roridomyces roridus]|uniref:non-specific serine/threonine protein kinase n=1 Tax=Roridomyces roridus TaxID=1738132 RepID=A0AAD7CJM2_9AGAR|nr:hypothetical protein FB45DRAFT_859238 [Roridomyces roridus]